VRAPTVRRDRPEEMIGAGPKPPSGLPPADAQGAGRVHGVGRAGLRHRGAPECPLTLSERRPMPTDDVVAKGFDDGTVLFFHDNSAIYCTSDSPALLPGLEPDQCSAG
jgi:hypothetical protein